MHVFNRKSVISVVDAVGLADCTGYTLSLKSAFFLLCVTKHARIIPYDSVKQLALQTKRAYQQLKHQINYGIIW